MKTPEKLNKNKISLGKIPRLDETPVKLILAVLYILGAILIRNARTDIAAMAETVEFISPLAVFATENILATYLAGAGLVLAILLLMPLGKGFVQEQLRSIGLVNHSDAVPELKQKSKDKINPRITVWEFTT